MSKYEGYPKCQDCGWKLGTKLTNNCNCNPRNHNPTAFMLYAGALKEARELQMNEGQQPQHEDCYNTGEPRKKFPTTWWQNSRYKDDRGDAVERGSRTKRGCASALVVVICAIVLPLMVFYVMALTMAQMCIELQEWILTNENKSSNIQQTVSR